MARPVLVRVISSVVVVFAVCTLSFGFPTGAAYAQSNEEMVGAEEARVEGMAIEEILVTARRREESLQDVPDSLTVFTAESIEKAGIDEVGDFVQLTPNVTFRETFRGGANFITVRGITTGQSGWPSVTYVVDGVPAASYDALNQGALYGIERIEVLKGPQSALYGAGAIAGAINIITKGPTEELSYGGKLQYGKGDSFMTAMSLSGPLVEGTSYFRLDGYYRDKGGLIKTNDGVPLDFEEELTVRGELDFHFGDAAINLRYHYGDIEAGAAHQQFLPPGADGLALIDNFDSPPGPGFARGIIGVEDRKFNEGSMKVDWELGDTTLSSITAYSKLDQSLFGSTSWQKPPAQSFCGPVGGAGEPPDCYQVLADNPETFSQDFRLTSPTDQSVHWVVGAAYLEREYLNVLRVGPAILGSDGSAIEGPSAFVNRIDLRNDEFWGIYAQLTYDLTSALELMLAGRYDKNDYDTTQYATLALQEPVPQADGSLVLNAEDDQFQPKVQLSYDFTDNVMAYGSISRGFRSGYYYQGQLAAPETTWNYEFGVKSTLWDGMATVNAAAFYIDYSDQQFTLIVPPPIVIETLNIAETKIAGIELEGTLRATEGFDIGFGLGITDAEVQDLNRTRAPSTPKYTLNVSPEYNWSIGSNLDGYLRVDYRFQSDQYLGRLNTFKVDSKDYINIRAALSGEAWTVTVYADNALDTRQATDVNAFPFGFIQAMNQPRSYGIEFGWRF